jgi:phage-related minor tail protein
MAEMRDLGRNVMGNFISDMVEGRKATDALADALRNVGNRLLNSGLDALFDGLFKGFSDGGFVGRGFAEGGYTGAGGKHQAKGVVHGGEYVFSKEATQRAGVGNLEAMHRSLKGYASGGLVGAMPSLPSMPKVAGAAQSGPPVVVNFNPQIDARGADQAGLARVEAQLQRMKGEMPAVAIDAVRKAQAGRML